MTAEEELIQGYIDAFNRHDIESVMACFLDDAVVDVGGLADPERAHAPPPYAT